MQCQRSQLQHRGSLERSHSGVVSGESRSMLLGGNLPGSLRLNVTSTGLVPAVTKLSAVLGGRFVNVHVTEGSLKTSADLLLGDVLHGFLGLLLLVVSLDLLTLGRASLVAVLASGGLTVGLGIGFASLESVHIMGVASLELISQPTKGRGDRGFGRGVVVGVGLGGSIIPALGLQEGSMVLNAIHVESHVPGDNTAQLIHDLEKILIHVRHVGLPM